MIRIDRRRRLKDILHHRFTIPENQVRKVRAELDSLPPNRVTGRAPGFAKKDAPSAQPIPFNVGAGLSHRVREFGLACPWHTHACSRNTMSYSIACQQQPVCFSAGIGDARDLELSIIFRFRVAHGDLSLAPEVALYREF